MFVRVVSGHNARVLAPWQALYLASDDVWAPFAGLDVVGRTGVNLALLFRWGSYTSVSTSGCQWRYGRTCCVPEVDDEPEDDDRERGEVQPVHGVVLECRALRQPMPGTT